MILGLGVDVCPVVRIGEILERQGDAFADRVFTAGEIGYAGTGRARDERLAARFAAKEATIKALGSAEGLRWRDIEVENAPDGAPSLRLAGAAEDRRRSLGASAVHLSLSHAGGVAVAVVILEGESDVG